MMRDGLLSDAEVIIGPVYPPSEEVPPTSCLGDIYGELDAPNELSWKAAELCRYLGVLILEDRVFRYLRYLWGFFPTSEAYDELMPMSTRM